MQQALRNTFRITKPTITKRTRAFSSTPATMALFPRFTQEFAPLFRLMDDYDRRVFFPNNQSLRDSVRSFTPKFDVKEVGDVYELHGEFPGVEQKDISIEWTDASTLTVSGHHEHVHEEGQRHSQATIKNTGSASAIEEGSAKDSAEKRYEKPTVEDDNAAESTKPTDTEKQIAKQSEQQEITKGTEGGPKYWVSERSVGEFHRSFSFPTRVDQDAVRASLKNGILSVVVPKAKAQSPRKIEIEQTG